LRRTLFHRPAGRDRGTFPTGKREAKSDYSQLLVHRRSPVEQETGKKSKVGGGNVEKTLREKVLEQKNMEEASELES